MTKTQLWIISGCVYFILDGIRMKFWFKTPGEVKGYQKLEEIKKKMSFFKFYILVIIVRCVGILAWPAFVIGDAIVIAKEGAATKQVEQ